MFMFCMKALNYGETFSPGHRLNTQLRTRDNLGSFIVIFPNSLAYNGGFSKYSRNNTSKGTGISSYGACLGNMLSKTAFSIFLSSR